MLHESGAIACELGDETEVARMKDMSEKVTPLNMENRTMPAGLENLETHML